MDRTRPSLSSLPFRPDAPWLAPLAGWSDLPFRLLCRERGAAVCCTEMVSAKGLIYASPGTGALLETLPCDAPLVVQLFGGEASFIGEAALRLRERGFSWFDCNMGCSVPKVTRAGAGAALCRDVDRALDVAEALIRSVEPGHAGFKIRLGWDRADTWRTLARGLEDAGAGWLTLHPRTAKQGVSGAADWSALRELKELAGVPVVASGDLFTAEDGVRCLEQTGADTVMYARGALRDPAVFAAHRALLRGDPAPAGPSAAALRALVLRHAELALAYSPKETALLKMRTIVPRYVHGLPGSKELRRAVIRCRDWKAFFAALDEFLPPA